MSGPFREGKWLIRATASSTRSTGTEFEEYIVNFGQVKDCHGNVIVFSGSGIGTTGKSKNDLVSIIGTVVGSCMLFVEEWTDCAEECRARLPNDMIKKF